MIFINICYMKNVDEKSNFLKNFLRLFQELLTKF